MKIISYKRFAEISLIIGWIAFAIYLNVIFFPVESLDARIFLEPWYDFIVAHGQFHAFSQNFSNYSPLYLYLLSLISLLSWIPKLAAIKLISLAFDFSAATAVHQIVKLKRNDSKKAWLAFFIVLFTPTVFIESGMWGQCDIIFTSFLLWMIYAFLQDRPVATVLFFSIAFAFKLQAGFIAPLILLLFLTRKLRPYWILLPPLIYFLSVVPAWIAGRPLWDLLTIYFTQTTAYRSLSLSAPNIYLYFSHTKYFSIFSVAIGLGIACIFSVVYLFVRWKKSPFLPKAFILFDATLLTMFFPFVLPMMHDRYFFTAALLLVVSVFFDKKFLIPAILVQVSSVISYFDSFHILFLAALIMNLAVVIWLLFYYQKSVRISRMEPVDKQI